MQIISRKPIIKELLEQCLHDNGSNNIEQLSQSIHQKILSQRVKFPLLEYCAHLLCDVLATNKQIAFCDEIEKQKSMGGNVLIGIILQKRLENHFDDSIEKATEYISFADAWYICDIIGERVYGLSLLNEPNKTIPKIKRLAKHESQWVVRSLGAGIHYCIKKGLDRKNVEILFQLLLSMANSKNKEIKQGIGWAAKTTAKFHPEIIKDYQTEIENKDNVGQWFRGKIKIGLNRNLYAQRNRS